MSFEDLILKASCIAFYVHYNSIVMHLDVCNWLCAGRFGLGWAHDAFYIVCHMFMHSHAYVLSFQSILWYFELLWDFFDCLLSLSLSLLLSVYVNLLLWNPNVNLLRPETLFIPRHPFLLTLLLSLFGFVIRRPNRTSLRSFLDEAFILKTKSSCRTSPTSTYPLSSIVGDRGHSVMPQSLVHPCWSRSFTPKCMDSTTQYLISLLVFEVRA